MKKILSIAAILCGSLTTSAQVYAENSTFCDMYLRVMDDAAPCGGPSSGGFNFCVPASSIIQIYGTSGQVAWVAVVPALGFSGCIGSGICSEVLHASWWGCNGLPVQDSKPINCAYCGLLNYTVEWTNQDTVKIYP